MYTLEEARSINRERTLNEELIKHARALHDPGIESLRLRFTGRSTGEKSVCQYCGKYHAKAHPMQHLAYLSVWSALRLLQDIDSSTAHGPVIRADGGVFILPGLTSKAPSGILVWLEFAEKIWIGPGSFPKNEHLSDGDIIKSAISDGVTRLTMASIGIAGAVMQKNEQFVRKLTETSNHKHEGRPKSSAAPQRIENDAPSDGEVFDSAYWEEARLDWTFNGSDGSKIKYSEMSPDILVKLSRKFAGKSTGPAKAVRSEIEFRENNEISDQETADTSNNSEFGEW